MKTVKAIFKTHAGRAWFSISIILLALFMTITTLTTGMFRPILDTVLGGKMPINNPDVEVKFTSDYATKKEAMAAGTEFNKVIEQEGCILLENANISATKKALPLAKGAKVSVFGKNSINLVVSGSGSGSVGDAGAMSLYDGLTDAGFQVNDTLLNFYKGDNTKRSSTALADSSSSAPTLAIGETPLNKYTSAVKKSYKNFNDAAIVVISRIGGESFDLPRFQDMKEGGIEGNHYLQLNQNEYDLLDHVTERFDNVIVLMNTLTSFDMTFLDEYNNTEEDKRIDAVMWIGGPGVNGALGIGKVLNGDVNPSGRTVDIYSRDFSKDPTWQNFGDNTQVNNGQNGSAYLKNGSAVPGARMVTYEEGVYLGYRYYETRGYEEAKVDPTSTWYADNVKYPFGYGLSYTTFTQEITSVTGTVADGLTITAKVKNTGTEAGKEVIQLYASAPYYAGGIEKSQVQLVDFAKTATLAAGAEATVTFHVSAYDLASYDYNDANGNDFRGYETEAGKYTFYLGANSHVEDAFDSAEVELATSIQFAEDPVTHKLVANKYTTEDFFDLQYRLSDVQIDLPGGEVATRKGMSRTNFEETFPTPLTEAERAFQVKTIGDKDVNEQDVLKDKSTNNPNVDSYTESPYTSAKDDKLMLRDMFGKSYDDEGWEKILNRLTFADMKALVNTGAFTTAPILSIGKNMTNDSDGPVGFVNFMPGMSQHYQGNATFACEIVIAATWNKDMAYQMGKFVGESGVWGDVGGNSLPYTGWYAPAVNLHRSPFSGRNYEYYSEDAILSGKMATNVINGAAQKGVYCDLKHFALNDQETDRAGIATFCTEQALRELFLKPFEIAVKGYDDPALVATATADGLTSFKGTTGIMSSFNRIGTRWTGGDYRLLTGILREEWGFRGLVICDYKTENTVMDARQMVYAGNDVVFASLVDLLWQDCSSSSNADLAVMRIAAHNILYTVANSNSVNVDIVGYKLEWWVTTLICVDVALVVICAAWGALVIIKKRKQF